MDEKDNGALRVNYDETSTHVKQSFLVNESVLVEVNVLWSDC